MAHIIEGVANLIARQGTFAPFGQRLPLGDLDAEQLRDERPMTDRVLKADKPGGELQIKIMVPGIPVLPPTIERLTAIDENLEIARAVQAEAVRIKVAAKIASASLPERRRIAGVDRSSKGLRAPMKVKSLTSSL